MSRLQQIKPGDALPEREFNVDNVQLFLYNAVLWNAHRIHFDQPYATETEGYPGLVIAGPQMGDWLSQCVVEWLAEAGELVSIDYRNRKAAYVGEALFTGGSVKSVDLQSGKVAVDLYVKNLAGEVIIPGAAVVRFPLV